jgi:pimeloyl-ACP methyl ester carboxylesterase
MGTKKLASALAPAAIDAMWQRLALQFGGFKRIEKVDAKAIGTAYTFRMLGAFEHSKLYIIVSISAERRVQGLFFRPYKKPKRPQTPKPPFPYLAAEVSFNNPTDKTKHGGTLTIPKGKGPFAAVVMITGSGSQDRDETIFDHKPFFVIADYLTRQGIAVLRVDDRGVGKSGGDPKKATIEIHATDVSAAVDFLETRTDIDKKKIGLIGHSEGGLLAAIVAAKRRDIAFAISMAGTGVSGAKITVSQVVAIAKASPSATKEKLAKLEVIQKRIVKTAIEQSDAKKLETTLEKALSEAQALGLSKETLTDEQIAERAKLEVTRLTAPWTQSFFKLDPATYWQKVRCPVLALNGEKDVQVDPKLNLPKIKAALEKAKNTDVTIEALPGLNHLFQEAKTGQVDEYARIEQTISPKVLERMAGWIKKRF